VNPDAIVGVDGELEHAAAILHPRFGTPVSAAVEHGAARRRVARGLPSVTLGTHAEHTRGLPGLLGLRFNVVVSERTEFDGVS
jgi:hypothetical protein